MTVGLCGVATGWSFVKCHCSDVCKSVSMIMLTELSVGEFTVA